MLLLSIWTVPLTSSVAETLDPVPIPMLPAASYMSESPMEVLLVHFGM